MSEIDVRLKTMLEAAVPPVDERGADWDDVLRRAERGERGDSGEVVRLATRRRGRRVWYALAAAVLLTALLVNPAFGVGDRILDWFTGTPAPEDVKSELSGMEPPEEVEALFRESGVREEEARGVMAIETRRGRAYLWAAPTEAGGWCTYVQLPTFEGAGSGSVGCDIGRPGKDPLVVNSATDAGGAEPLTVLEGRVDPRRVVSLELVFADGSAEELRFVERFFIYEVLPGREPTVVVARDAQGRVVASDPVHGASTGAAAPPGAGDDGSGDASTREGRRTLMRLATSTGARARLWIPRERAGRNCYGIVVDGGYEGEICMQPRHLVTSHLESVEGQERPLVLLHGFVAPQVGSLELVFADGKRARVRLVEHFFLHEIPPGRATERRRPTAIVARDSSGRGLGRVPVRSAFAGP